MTFSSIAAQSLVNFMISIHFSSLARTSLDSFFQVLTKKDKMIALITSLVLVALAVGVYYCRPLSHYRFSSRPPESNHLQSRVGTLPFIPANEAAQVPPSSTLQTTFQELVHNTQSFESYRRIPTTDNRIETLISQGIALEHEIVAQANQTRPILHENVVQLMEDFLHYKKQLGSPIEQALYSTMDVQAFIDRLLVKRPLAFLLPSDSYLLRDGRSRGYGQFETIGTEAEQAPLTLNDYLSYDEMQLSAFLAVSTPTYFINNGNRHNRGIASSSQLHEKSGVYVGLVGARFEREEKMEWQHMLITAAQNTKDNGYGIQNVAHPYLKLWSAFYGHPFPTFEEAQNDTTGNFLRIDQNTYLNIAIYKERMRLVIEPFLIEANQRASDRGKTAYVHTVGLGLGVWQISPRQAEFMLEVYADVLSKHHLPFISDLNFSWFPEGLTCGGVNHLEIFETGLNKVRIHFSKRNPADKLSEQDTEKLIVASYAWDSNSYPGNEYWNGQLTASGDPAAACCSTIPQLQNPLINTSLTSKKLFISKNPT